MNIMSVYIKFNVKIKRYKSMKKVAKKVARKLQESCKNVTINIFSYFNKYIYIQY